LKNSVRLEWWKDIYQEEEFGFNVGRIEDLVGLLEDLHHRRTEDP
jgi:RNA polymerase-interacting CarD/CdnL/TRCF family regulator